MVRRTSGRCLAEHIANPKKGGKACFAPLTALFQDGLSQIIALEIGGLETSLILLECGYPIDVTNL